jgi:hypothetical protein
MTEMQSSLAGLQAMDLDGTLESLLQVYSNDRDVFFFLATERIEEPAAYLLSEAQCIGARGSRYRGARLRDIR